MQYRTTKNLVSYFGPMVKYLGLVKSAVATLDKTYIIGSFSWSFNSIFTYVSVVISGYIRVRIRL